MAELKDIQSQLKTGHTGKTKCVEQINPINDQVLRVYPSITAAANFMGISISHISECCNGKLQTCGGFKWRFYDGPLLDCKYKLHNIIMLK